MVTSPRRLTAAAVLLATAFGGTLSTVTTADAAPDRDDRDDRAVARAADRYDVSEAALRDRLAEDSSLRLTPSGVAFFVDPLPADTPETPGFVAQAFPLDQTFLLHSKPDSQKTIYLDFNGHTVSNTLWNSPPNNVPNGQAHPAMDLAGNGPAFSDAELMQIQDIFQRVAEDYAPFDVDVTTEEPPAADIDRTNAGDQVYGTRALISPSTSAAGNICDSLCGGVAFTEVFNHYSGKDGFVETHAQLQPAWVFPHLLGNGNVVKNVAEATTHEVGHNLGLDHDGTTSLDYYTGHNGWAPIMGVGYQQPIVQFALNDYPNADLGGSSFPDTIQDNPDDIVTITNFGAAPRTDEPGTSTGNAGAVPTTGYISNRNDVDFFNLGTCSGTVTVTGNPAPVSPNLDIELQLLNSGGTALDTDNPTSAFVSVDQASGLNAHVSASSQPSGTFYVRIDGVGRGNATTGYTDYGSLGAYTLSVNGCAGGPTAEPPSAPQNLTAVGQSGGEVDVSWSPPADDGGAAVTDYNMYVDGQFLDNTQGATGGTIAGLTPGETYSIGVSAVNSAGEGPQTQTNVTLPGGTQQAKPGKPRIGDATPGKRGGKLTAKVRWLPPAGTTNPAINGYQVIAYKRNSNGSYVKVATSAVFPAGARSVTFEAGSRGKYKFAVKARNSLGFGPLSAKSNAVTPR